MIRDVMVRLDGTAADEIRLSAVDDITELFQSRVIGLYLNLLPMLAPAPSDHAGSFDPLDLARAAGDEVESRLNQRLVRLQKPVLLRRVDIFSDAVAETAARAARTADAFVALRPNGSPQESDHLIEGVLFGSGRHLILVPNRHSAKLSLEHVMIAWDGSRESARALGEALPYLHRAKTVTVVVVDEDPVEEQAVKGTAAVDHLKQHGIKATLHHKLRNDSIGTSLIGEARDLKATLIVMGGYGHSRLREWLLGGTTYELLHHAPVPLLIAH